MSELESDPPSIPSTGLFRRLTWEVIAFALGRLPMALAKGLFAMLVVGTALWLAAMPDALPWWSPLVFFGFFILAGLLLGVVRALYLGGTSAVELLESHAREISDVVLDAVAKRAPAKDLQLPIATIREHWDDIAERFAPASSGRFSLIGRLSKVLARPGLRFLRWAIVDDFLGDLAAKGERHVTVRALNAYVRDHMLSNATQMARRRLQVVQLVGLAATALVAAVGIALVLLPS